MKIEELEALVAKYEKDVALKQAVREQGGNAVTSHDQNSIETLYNHPVFHPTIDQRVYDVVARAGEIVTRGEIAAALGLKKTPWLTNVIEKLVSRGLLKRHETRWHNGMPLYGYELA